jgi:hypothetical protein
LVPARVASPVVRNERGAGLVYVDMTTTLTGFAIGMVFCAVALGCGSSSGASASSGALGAPDVDAGNVSAGTAQTPPMGEGNLVAWLATGQYKAWHCEPAVHASRGPSVHTPFDRVCSNDLLSGAVPGTGPWPQGAAEVKEIYMAMSDATPTGGYAVSLKTSADSAGGANWYFYERFDGTLFADGMGTGLCLGCHSLAGTDATNTTTTGARDFVFTPVP